LIKHCGVIPASICAWLIVEISCSVMVFGSQPQIWLAQQLHSAIASTARIASSWQTDGFNPEHVWRTRPRSFDQDVGVRGAFRVGRGCHHRIELKRQAAPDRLVHDVSGKHARRAFGIVLEPEQAELMDEVLRLPARFSAGLAAEAEKDHCAGDDGSRHRMRGAVKRLQVVQRLSPLVSPSNRAIVVDL